ncbi:phage tail assembly chaperone [Clostridium butyricum]
MQLTIENLLQNKGIINEQTGIKTTQLTIKRLGGEITIQSLKSDKLDQILDEASSGKSSFEINKKAIYMSVIDPNLKDNELLKGYGCKSNPYEIVEKIFTRTEIGIVADKIAELNGIGEVKKLDDFVVEIKN